MMNAEANGMTIQQIIIKGSPKPGREAIGPTSPTNPNPELAGTPLIEKIATGIAQTIAFANIATIMIGFLKKLGIIIFMEPKAIAIGTPGLLTRIVESTNTAVVAATPIAAAPAETPFKPIAIPKATVDIGEIMRKAKDIPIKIDIGRGAKLVKVLIRLPNAVVIPET